MAVSLPPSLRVFTVAGREVLRMDASEAQRRDDACLTVKDVKKYCIQSVDGVSIYRHRLLLEDEVLDDTKQLPLELWPLDLQLLVCPFHSPDANTIREFRAAVRSGEDAALEALLKKGIDPNLPGERWHGGSALQLASSNGSVEMVRMLLEATSDPNMADHEGKSPLLVASNKGYLEIVRCLLEMDADANLANCNDNTPLWVASWKGHLEVVRSLLKFKANHRKVNHNVESALWVASEHGHLKVVQLLIDAEAHVDSCDYNNTSPLWVASWKGHREVVDLLLQSKANQHLMDKVFGATPLWVASKHGHVDVVRFLLKAHGDQNKANRENLSPLVVAAYWGHLNVLGVLLMSWLRSRCWGVKHVKPCCS